jgi:ubiquinone/menaquinone biosynthesis C-methylase UbiE
MVRAGADVVGIDISENQLKYAREFMKDNNIKFELIHGNAEKVPLPDSTFDFAISEYGAATWCDPFRWIPEAHRLLKSGGTLTFLGNHPLYFLTASKNSIDSSVSASKVLHRPYFDMHFLDWKQWGDLGTEFNLTHSSWLRLNSVPKSPHCFQSKKCISKYGLCKTFEALTLLSIEFLDAVKKYNG